MCKSNDDSKNRIKSLNDNPVFAMSLSSKELFHSNFLAWILMYEKWKDKITEIKRLFGISKGEEIYYVYREKQHFDLLIAYGKLKEDISQKLKDMLNVYSDYDDEEEKSQSKENEEEETDSDEKDSDCFSCEEFETIQKNLKFVVIENKLKSIPTEEQLNDYDEKIEKGIRIEKFKVKNKKDDRTTNKWLYLNSGNVEKYLFAPRMTIQSLVSSSRKRWKNACYECYLCKLKNLLRKIPENDASAEIVILKKYAEMLSVILEDILENLLDEDLKNEKPIPSKENVELLKTVRLADLYQKIWASSCLFKINSNFEKETFDSLKEYAAKFTNGTGLMEWKISAKDGEILAGVQIQYKQFRVFVVPAKNEKKFKDDSITQIKEWEQEILKELENDDVFEKLKENQEIKKFANFKYLYLTIKEDSDFNKLSESVEKALKLISEKKQELNSLEFEQ